MKLPTNSRGWQWYQHATGGLYNILLMATGVSFAKENVLLSIVLAITTFLINRASSEISYRTSMCVVRENNGR